eukprot:5536482-Pyramimonas_sp.AAC.2
MINLSTAATLPQRPRRGRPGIFLKYLCATSRPPPGTSMAAWKIRVGAPHERHTFATVATVPQ